MTLDDIYKELEPALENADTKILKEICVEMFPEEDFSDIEDNDIANDLFKIITEEIKVDKAKAEFVYFFLFDEKININDDQFIDVDEEYLEYG